MAIFNPATDSLVGYQITTAGGKYLFQNLAAADYWVQVVESTVPAGYTTTTYNTPMLVNLGEGESYLDADFGYATPSTLDYGDAPDTGAGAAQGNYNTVSADNGPRHTIVSTLKLGNVAPDGDSGFLQNVDATADDLINADDEDGVAVLPEILASTTSVQVTVKAANTAPAPRLWPAGSTSTATASSRTPSSAHPPPCRAAPARADYTLTFSGLSGLVAGPSYLRCRIAYASGEVANATGAAASGEVEDYKVTIGAQPDFGDAPDVADGTGQGDYNTRSADSGPNHVIVAGLQLGCVAPDGDNGTLQNANADADDLNNHRRRRRRQHAADDQQYVDERALDRVGDQYQRLGGNPRLLDRLQPRRRLRLNRAPIRKRAEPGGRSKHQLTFTGFGTPVPGVSYLRCRIANTASQVTNPTGAATSGEVEDYKVTIIGLDYGDAPDTGIGVAQGNYNTQANDNGPNHVIVGGLSLGSIPPDADPGTLQDIDASADNTDNVNDEDGVAVSPGGDSRFRQRCLDGPGGQRDRLKRHGRLLDRLQPQRRLRRHRAEPRRPSPRPPA